MAKESRDPEGALKKIEADKGTARIMGLRQNTDPLTDPIKNHREKKYKALYKSSS